MANEFKLPTSLTSSEEIKLLKSRIDEIEDYLKEFAMIQTQLAKDMCTIHQALRTVLVNLQPDTDLSFGPRPVDKELLN